MLFSYYLKSICYAILSLIISGLLFLLPLSSLAENSTNLTPPTNLAPQKSITYTSNPDTPNQSTWYSSPPPSCPSMASATSCIGKPANTANCPDYCLSSYRLDPNYHQTNPVCPHGYVQVTSFESRPETWNRSADYFDGSYHVYYVTSLTEMEAFNRLPDTFCDYSPLPFYAYSKCSVTPVTPDYGYTVNIPRTNNMLPILTFVLNVTKGNACVGGGYNYTYNFRYVICKTPNDLVPIAGTALPAKIICARTISGWAPSN